MFIVVQPNWGLIFIRMKKRIDHLVECIFKDVCGRGLTYWEWFKLYFVII